MSRLSTVAHLTRKTPLLASFLDKIIHPTREPKPDDDPSRPFTPPPPDRSKEEKEDDDDGPSFPMNPALA